jgi:hypothetical protein
MKYNWNKTDYPKKTNLKVGRPSVMTPKIIERLRAAFALDSSKVEACSYAGIGESTLYDYLSVTPEFSEEITKLKNQAVLKARKTVVDNLDDVDTAKWYLSRKRKDEFGTALVEIKNDNRSIQIVKEDPRAFNTMMKAFENMKKNLENLENETS